MLHVLDEALALLHQADPVLDGTGLPTALAMLLALLVLLPRDQRYKIGVPVWLLAGHLAAGAALILLRSGFVERLFVLLAASLLLASLGRCAFLLIVDTFLMRRSGWAMPQILRDVLQAVLFGVIGLLVLRAAGVEPGSLLTTSALLTAVIGLSLQETLGNLFAGLAIQAQRPFDVGDWIQFDRHNCGKVLGINWRATHVLTVEEVEVIVPNGTIAKAPIHNFSRPSRIVRRSVEIATAYAPSPARVHEILLEGLRDTPGVLAHPKPSVVTKSFAEDRVHYEARYFIDDYATREVIDGAARDRLWYALGRAGLQVPLPTRRLELARRRESGKGPAAQALIEGTELFRHLPKEDAAKLFDASARRLYARGEHIVRRGQRGSEMFLIEHGKVSVRVGGASEGAIAELSEGQFFGELSLMTGEARSADVVALGETQVLVIGREALAPLLEQNPGLADHISRVLAERAPSVSNTEVDQRNSEVGTSQELLSRIRSFFSL